MDTSDSQPNLLEDRQSAPIVIQLMLESDSTAEVVRVGLSERGYKVKQSDDAWQGPQPRRNPPDIVVFDLFSADPRRLQNISVLRGLLGNPLCLCIASTRDRETLAAAIRLGIDEFIFEPFDLVEVEQRIELLLCRRFYTSGSTRYPFVERRSQACGANCQSNKGCSPAESSFQVRQSTKSVVVDGQEVRLSPREFQIVVLLAQEPGRIFSTEEIIRAVWPSDGKATSADVHRCMHIVRRKTEKCPDAPQWIKNIKGFGYTLNTGTLA